MLRTCPIYYMRDDIYYIEIYPWWQMNKNRCQKSGIKTLAIIGLGYVGLPLAVAFAKKGYTVIAFDINQNRIESLQAGIDQTNSVPTQELNQASLTYTSSEADLHPAEIFIVAVPTPVDDAHSPDLTPLIAASEIIGRNMRVCSIVCYESTVYPGVTEEICAPALERVSGFTCGKDFTLGYSPERINPGDTVHRFETIVKIVSGQDQRTCEALETLYGSVVDAGVFVAPSIRVAEAAKIIENTQRDTNIALMNEFAMIFERLNICTSDVLEAAGTKWNFLQFRPGLVGGHCIGVDPYYLIHKSETTGYSPKLIRASRQINDAMGTFIAQKTVKLMAQMSIPIPSARVGIFGLTFKEDVSDIRNTRVPTIFHELQEYQITPLVADPHGDSGIAFREYGISLTSDEDMNNLDVVILTVPHSVYCNQGIGEWVKRLRDGKGLIVDVKGIFVWERIEDGVGYWSL